MNALWTILAFALVGAEDPKATATPPSHSPFTITFTVGDEPETPQDSPNVTGIIVPTLVSPATLPAALPKVRAPQVIVTQKADETWPMTLQDAIRIGLDNSEIVRVIAFGAQGIPIGGFEPGPFNQGAGPDLKRVPIVIARLNADAAAHRLQSDLMAHLRSIEQQYWNLAQAHAQVACAEQLVKTAREVLATEQVDIATDTHARGGDLAEARQRLEQFNLDLVTRTSDVITTERQFRKILGLPPADNRRIIPVTPPIEARLEPDWDSSLAEMLEFQPDIVQQQALVRLAELQLIIARNQLLPPFNLNTLDQLNSLGQQLEGTDDVMLATRLKMLGTVIEAMEKAKGTVGDPANYRNFSTWQFGYTVQAPLEIGRAPLANTRQSQYILLRSRAHREQVIHRTTHALARFFLEIDANYKQFKVASRLRAAADARMKAQRTCYDEGRITIGRYFDAISQYTAAAATEAQYKTAYNVSIVSLEEAKGTLLEYENIVIAEPHRRPLTASPDQPKPDDQAKQASVSLPSNPFDNIGPPLEPTTMKPAPAAPPTNPVDTKVKAVGAESKPRPQTWTFSISIAGFLPLEIKGTITAPESCEGDSPGR